ncbi:universal stress protein UspA [Arthrobacter sp. Soil736]|uniref:universal stress protein n=1 Tax=Arthrobacter sp. Soil736 TaxID=1736395 RepID=UPI0006FC5B9D|nr:universal stress protein [Arthrobacter sp. Soil736]KRE64995.1 universal stress protein UspA [Arthrobacter sp. Soil736]
MTGPQNKRIIVGVDGSDSSIEALRQAQHIALGLGSKVEAWSCWEFPVGHEAYEAMGTDGFAHTAEEALQAAITKAFGPERPPNVSPRLVHGAPRPSLINASKDASFLVVGRRGHGGFVGLSIGSVSSACVAHAHCPVLVVHTPRPVDEFAP